MRPRYRCCPPHRRVTPASPRRRSVSAGIAAFAHLNRAVCYSPTTCSHSPTRWGANPTRCSNAAEGFHRASGWCGDVYPALRVGPAIAAPLIGVLNAASAKSTASSYEAFRAALRQLGYFEGRNIRIEYRYADGFLDRLPALAEEVVGLNPKVIVSGPTGLMASYEDRTDRAAV